VVIEFATVVVSCTYLSLSLELQTFPHVIVAACEQDSNNALGVGSSLCRIDGERVGSAGLIRRVHRA
jgi:hypothetical protein